MPFLNFATPHCHVDSLDSASTPKAFAQRELELETGALTITDHGTLQSVRKVYDLVKDKKSPYFGKLTPILGVEGYFRDDSCPILAAAGVPKNDKGTYVDFFKYGHLTLHALDADGYETLCRVLSDADGHAEKHGSERKPLFTWRDLEELGGKNITVGSGCLIGMVQRFIMAHGRFDLAEAYYRRLRSTFKPGNFFVEVFPHVCDRNWDETVFVKFSDGSTEKFPIYKNLKTDKKPTGKKGGEGWKAKDLAANWHRSPEGHGCLRAVMQDRKWVEYDSPRQIVGVEHLQDFIVNDCQPWAPGGDLQYGCNKAVIELAAKYGDKILISDDSHFVRPDEKVIQDIRLQQSGSWRFSSAHFRYSSDDAWQYFRDVLQVPEATFESWIDNSREWSQRFKDFKFKDRASLPVKFYPADSWRHTAQLVLRHGRMQVDPPHVERFKSEIELLHKNGTIDLLPYFFIDEEAVYQYERRGELTGPGRGSAAGLSLTYLMGITHADPLRYGLSKDRFLTLDRIQSKKLPDIDQDLPEREKTLLPWLEKRFAGHYAQISVDTTLKLRSSVKDVARWKRAKDGKSGFVPPEIENLAKKFEEAPQGVTDYDFVFGYKGADGWVQGSLDHDPALQQYIALFPDEWALVQKCLGLSRQKGRHASAFVITNEPIKNFIPLTSVSDVTVTQFTANSVEAMGGLKMDFLVVSALNDIGACIRLIQKRSADQSQPWSSAYQHFDTPFNDIPDDFVPPSMTIDGLRVPLLRVVPFKGGHVDIWDLPEIQAVFREICEQRTETVFQFNTPGAKKWLRHFDSVSGVEADGTVHKALDSIEDLAAFTALDRPGPLDATPTPDTTHNMLVEFANRAKGKPAVGVVPMLMQLISETHGVITYQEQLTRIFRETGKSTAIEAENFRIHVSKKMPMEIIKDKAIFMKGAVETVGPEVADQLWSMMETFGQYGFNKSHAVCYVIISYACAWLKHHFPLEWWTSVLTNADRKEIEEKFWPYCGHLIDSPDINNSGDGFEIQGTRIRAPLNLIQGIGPAGSAELNANRPYASLREFCEKIVAQKRATSTTTLDPENGKSSVKAGRSALHRGIVTRLTCSGVMDSLFGPEVLDEVGQKLEAYERITAELAKKRKWQPVDPFYTTMNPMQRYQLKKSILSAYGADLIPMALDMKVEGFRMTPTGCEYAIDKGRMGVIRALDLEVLGQQTLLPPGGLKFVVLAYVNADVRQKFQGTKDMAKLTLDVEGHRQEFVQWPRRGEEILPIEYRSGSLKGAVVAAILTRWNSEKPFQISGIEVLQPPLKDLKEEE
jgi:DNA polymerase III alpha subunit